MSLINMKFEEIIDFRRVYLLIFEILTKNIRYYILCTNIDRHFYSYITYLHFYPNIINIKMSMSFISFFSFFDTKWIHDICLRIIYCIIYQPFRSIIFFHLSENLIIPFFQNCCGLFAKYCLRYLFISFMDWNRLSRREFF